MKSLWIGTSFLLLTVFFVAGCSLGGWVSPPKPSENSSRQVASQSSQTVRQESNVQSSRVLPDDASSSYEPATYVIGQRSYPDESPEAPLPYLPSDDDVIQVPVSQTSRPSSRTVSSHVSSTPKQNINENNQINLLSLQTKLDALIKNAPSIRMTCTYCGGDGKLDEDCSRCGGTGMVSIGAGNIMSLADCPSCRGRGKVLCKKCFGGEMWNPNYESEIKVWNTKRRNILKQMGYSDLEIKRMEQAEAQAYIDARNGGNSNQDTADILQPAGICRVCKGSKKCEICGGKGSYQNRYLPSEWISCSNCRQTGDCPACNGTGRRT